MNRLKYSLLVLIGACSYGILSTIMKFAYAEGFHINEVIGSQYFFGWILLLFLLLTRARYRVTKKQALSLLLAGTATSLTGIFYGFALKKLPASIAIVLLFQFTWIGIACAANHQYTKVF
jgi:drug/metabolite transporter (DMT)-like permease